jgi:Ca-activated chloride channel family protein
LNTNLAPNAGTDFGAPMNIAIEKLESATGIVSQQKSKIILLISDGEDFGEETDKDVKFMVVAE